MSITTQLKSEYTITSTPLGGLVNAAFQKKKDKFAYLDYDVAKGFKWNMKIYADEAKTDLLIEVEEQSAISGLLDQSGYVFKNAKTGETLGAWVPKKRFLNMFLKAHYKLMVNNDVVATAPGEGFFKLFIPGSMRKLMGRKVFSADGNLLTKIHYCLSGGVNVIPQPTVMSDDFMSMATAVFAAICSIQD